MEQRVRQDAERRRHAGVGDEDVDVAVVVVVAESETHPEADAGEARLLRHLGEGAVAVVVVELHGRGNALHGAAVGHEEIDPAVPVVIGEGAHAGADRRIDARRGADVAEVQMAVVVIEPVFILHLERHAAGRADEDVEQAVVVDVAERRLRLHLGRDDPRGGGDVGEGAVAVVAEEAHHRFRRVQKAAVAGDQQLLIAVVVEVRGHRGHDAGGDRKTRRLGHVGERAVAIVVIENAFQPRAVAEEKVEPAVAVIVEPDGAAQAVAADVLAAMKERNLLADLFEAERRRLLRHRDARECRQAGGQRQKRGCPGEAGQFQNKHELSSRPPKPSRPVSSGDESVEGGCAVMDGTCRWNPQLDTTV